MCYYLIVGLGNIGVKYTKHRHNIGFILVDKLLEVFGHNKLKETNNALIYETKINDNKVLLLKPKTYMNLSGKAVLSALSNYKINKSKICVIHDDLDLDFSRLKIKSSGGHAGHNGLRDINSSIGNEYLRLRYGIGRPDNPHIATSDFVLSNFKAEEFKQMESINHYIAENIMMVFDNPNNFLNGYVNR